MTDRNYVFRLMDSLSQLVNVALLNGDPDESISGRAYRRTMEGSTAWRNVMRAIDALFFWQESHSADAYASDLERAEARIKAHRSITDAGTYREARK